MSFPFNKTIRFCQTGGATVVQRTADVNGCYTLLRQFVSLFCSSLLKQHILPSLFRTNSTVPFTYASSIDPIQPSIHYWLAFRNARASHTPYRGACVRSAAFCKNCMFGLCHLGSHTVRTWEPMGWCRQCVLLNWNCETLVWAADFVSGLLQGKIGAAGIRRMHCGNLWIPSWTMCSWQFLANAVHGEQAATVNLIKCKRNWACLVKPITRHAWWDNRLW